MQTVVLFCCRSNPSQAMSLACLVCHSAESPSSQSFRSYSVSSSDNEGRCSAIANCLTRRPSLPLPPTRSSTVSSKVTPHPNSNPGMGGPPRLVRSHAVSRDLVRDWNFDEVVMVERQRRVQLDQTQMDGPMFVL